MIIEAKIRKARKNHFCTMCHKQILCGNKYICAFGMAESGDPPYWVKLCDACRSMSKSEIKWITNRIMSDLNEEDRYLFLQDLSECGPNLYETIQKWSDLVKLLKTIPIVKSDSP